MRAANTVLLSEIMAEPKCSRTAEIYIKRRLEGEGWILERVAGSHHVFKHPKTQETIVLPHPKKDLGRGLVRAIYKQAKWKPD